MNPTLFVGLGGTGKQTLMQLRRHILDGYGPGVLPQGLLDRYGPGRLPHTAFLCLDSDAHLADLDAKAFDERLQAVAMRGSEMLPIAIDPQQMEEFYLHPENFPAYLPWYERSLKKLQAPRHGCGQTRPWGRYAFFQHYEDIRQSLKSALETLVDTRTVADAREAGVSLDISSLNVFLVFSVAGGTGSGTFLDVAYLLRDLDLKQEVRPIRIQALILMPGAFSNRRTAKIFANAYAALLELEHYSLARKGAEGFPIHWPGRYDGKRKPERIAGPPFEAAWLVSEQPRGWDGRGGAQVHPSRKVELTGMMAEWLYLRCSPRHVNLGGKINSDASNYIATQMADVASLPIFDQDRDRPVGALEQSRRYGSFGLSKIYMPKAATQQAVANRLIGDLVRGWLREPPESGAGVEETLRSLGRRAFGGGEGSEEDPLGLDALFTAVTRTAITEVEAALIERVQPEAVIAEAIERGGDARGALAARLRVFHEEWASDESGDLSRMGASARSLRLNGDAVFQAVREALDLAMAEVLDHPGKRFGHGRALLDQAAEAFRQLAAEAELRAQEEGRHASHAEVGLDLILSWLAAEQLRPAWLDLIGMIRDRRGQFVPTKLAAAATRYRALASSYDLRRQGYEQVARVAQRVVGLIEQAEVGADGLRKGAGLAQRLNDLSRDLEALAERAERRIGDGQARPTSSLNRRVEVAPDQLYVTAQGGPMAGEALREIEVRLLSDPDLFPQGRGSPWALRDRLAGAGADSVLAALDAFARRETSHVTRSADRVLQSFDAQHPANAGNASYVEALRPLVSAATAWLPVGATGDHDWVQDAARTMRLAFRDDDSPASARLKHALSGPGADFPNLNLSISDLPDGDAIYLTEELAGFPLAAVPGIGEWRQTYLSWLTDQTAADQEDQNPSSALHVELDPTRYGSLVRPKPAEVTQRATAISLLVEALAKGVVVPAHDEWGGIVFQRHKTVGFNTVREELGRYERAVQQLQLEHVWRELVEQVQQRERDWTRDDDEGQEAKARVLAILGHHLDGRDRPISLPEWTLGVGQTIERLSGRYGSETVELARRFSRNLGAWTEQRPAGSGFVIARAD